VMLQVAMGCLNMSCINNCVALKISDTSMLVHPILAHAVEKHDNAAWSTCVLHSQMCQKWRTG
jgi:hypothetical protein